MFKQMWGRTTATCSGRLPDETRNKSKPPEQGYTTTSTVRTLALDAPHTRTTLKVPTPTYLRYIFVYIYIYIYIERERYMYVQ